MNKNIKVSVKKPSSFGKKGEFGTTELILNFSGKDVNPIIVNSIKRIIQSDIPIYAFDKFSITENTSVFNNNYIKNHIRNIPVWGIENKLTEFVEETKQEEEEEVEVFGIIKDDVDLSTKKETDYSSLNKLTMYLDYENKSNEIYHVTTENCIFYYKEGMIKSPYYNKVQIVKLQPNQKIKLSVQANPGTNDISAIYSATSVCYFIENKEDDYDFIVESKGQVSEVRIIKIGLNLIINKLKKFLQNLPKSKGMEGILKVDNEDHLLGNLLTYQMQKLSSVKFCGYTTPHPLNKEINIEYKISTGNINLIFKEVVSYYENIFKLIGDQLDKIKTKE